MARNRLPAKVGGRSKNSATDSAKVSAWVSFVVLALFLGATLYVGFHPSLRRWMSDPAAVAQWIRSYGSRAVLACIAIQFLQVVIFVVPGVVTEAAAGYVFGAPLGFLLAFSGIMLGSWFSFFLARWLGRPFVVRVVDAKLIGKLDSMIESRKGRVAFFFAFLLPGLPKDALCYAAGATSISYRHFLLYSLSGRIPALVYTVFFGGELAKHDYLKLTVASVVFGVLFLIAVAWARRKHS